MTARDDFLKFQVPGIVGALLAKNVSHVLRFYTDPEIKLGHVFHLDIRLDEKIGCNDEECRFFRGFLN